MSMFPEFGGLTPTEAEMAALDALLNQGETLVSGLVDVAELIAAVCQADGDEIPVAVAAELAAVRRSGGVTSAVRRAGIRTTRRAERAKLRTLTGELDGARVLEFRPRPVMISQVTGGWAA